MKPGSEKEDHGSEAVILIGHGATAKDMPRHHVRELKAAEAARRAQGLSEPSEKERELDALVRGWPRTPETDPYGVGLAAIAEALTHELGGTRVIVAFNELAAPSVSDAIDSAVAEGARRIKLVSIMVTRGGVHSEEDLPQEIEAARARHRGVELVYAWPFDPRGVAALLRAQLARF